MSSLKCPCCDHVWPSQEVYDDHVGYMQKYGLWPKPEKFD